MESVSGNSSCFPSWQSICQKVKKVAESVALFAYFLFQTCLCLWHGNFSELVWNGKNFLHLKKAPPYVFTSPPYYSEKDAFEAPFSQFCQVYKEIHGLKDDVALRKNLNGILSDRFCHAECQGLVELALENNYSLKKALSDLKSLGKRLTYLQILEIFRFTFDTHKRNELNEVIALTDKNITKTLHYQIQNIDISSSLQSDFSDKNGFVLVRLVSETSCHTVVVELNSKEGLYSFFNDFFAGYYEYPDLNSFITAFTEHVRAHTDALEKTPKTRWELSFVETS